MRKGETKYSPWSENLLSHLVWLKTNDRGLLCSYFGVLNGMSSTVILASVALQALRPSQPAPPGFSARSRLDVEVWQPRVN